MQKKNEHEIFMFNTDKNIDVSQIRSANELSQKKFIQWKQLELVNFLDLYYKYFTENRDSDNVMDFSEYITSGRYKKDRNE